jgi:hypothetical protein
MNNTDFKCALTQAVLTGVVVYLLLTYVINPSPLASIDKSKAVEMSVSLYAALAALLANFAVGFIQPSCPQKSTLF